MSRHIHTSESKLTSVHERATGGTHSATLDRHRPQIVLTGVNTLQPEISCGNLANTESHQSLQLDKGFVFGVSKV